MTADAGEGAGEGGGCILRAVAHKGLMIRNRMHIWQLKSETSLSGQNKLGKHDW
jgi:hypothetical protein